LATTVTHVARVVILWMFQTARQLCIWKQEKIFLAQLRLIAAAARGHSAVFRRNVMTCFVVRTPALGPDAASQHETFYP
jgi:hypothetical protein